MPPIRLMSYNVRYFGHSTRGLASTREGVKRIARSIAALSPQPDLVCLQEVETVSLRSAMKSGRKTHGEGGEETQLELLLKDLHKACGAERYQANYFPAHAYRLTKATNFYTTGLAILARDTLRIVDHNAETPHDITDRKRLTRMKQTRICAHSTFETASGAKLDVFNTHLSLPSFLAKEFWTQPKRLGFGKNQLAEATKLMEFVHQKRTTENFVIMGDFNSLPDSPVDQYLRGDHGLKDALRTMGTGRFASAGFLHLRMHIDHIYASPGIEFLDLDGTAAFGSGAFDGLSDHVPLIARCSV